MNPAIQKVLTQLVLLAWRELGKKKNQDKLIDWFEEMFDDNDTILAVCRYLRRLLDIEETEGSPWADEDEMVTVNVQMSVPADLAGPRALAPLPGKRKPATPRGDRRRNPG